MENRVLSAGRPLGSRVSADHFLPVLREVRVLFKTLRVYLLYNDALN